MWRRVGGVSAAIRGLLFLFSLFCVLFSVDEGWSQEVWPDLMKAGPRFGGGGQDAAVVVGVEDYAFVPDVPGAVDNALAWVRFLRDDVGVPSSRIKPLLNGAATRENIEEEVKRASASMEPAGQLWFIFVGHGAASAAGLDGLLVGVDAEPTARSLYARSASRDQLLAVLASSRAGHVLALLDTCFSGRSGAGGALADGLQPLITRSAPPTSSKVTLLTAGRGTQLAGLLPGASRPAFSYLMLGALRGWGDTNGDGAVTESEAHGYLLNVLALLLAGSRVQTPELWSAHPEGSLLKLPRRGQRLEAAPSLEPVLRWIATSSGASMVEVPGGEFQRGTPSSGEEDERPAGRVYVSPFWMDKTEVTVDAYASCVKAGKCTHPDTSGEHCSGGYANENNWLHRAERGAHPVNCVEWSQAVTYCRWAGKRLPTEAEWEKAARGVDGRTYPWGEEVPSCRYTVMFEGRGIGCGEGSTWAVGSKPAGASPYGALDMSGNVWEWVSDRYTDSYSGVAGRDPEGTSRGSSRVLRGASFYDDGVSRLRAADRRSGALGSAYAGLGFRCARSERPSSEER